MPPSPNIVLAVIGGARADHLSCYGHARRTTPFLDRVANEGVRVAHVIATAATPMAAHAALFTGRFSAEHQAHEEARRLEGGGATLAERLRDAGYRTAAFCTDPAVSPETGLGRGFDVFVTQRRQSRLADRAWSYGRRAGDRLLRRRDAGGRRTNEAFKEWLGSEQRPFFAFLHYEEARLPVGPLAAGENPFVRELDATLLRNVDQSGESYVAGAAELAAGEAEVVQAAYDSGLHYVDSRLREVADNLEQLGVWDDTLLVVAGDHGQLLGEHGWLGSPAGLSEPLLRVPLIMRCPGLVPQGFVVEELAQSVDVAPTVLGLVRGPESCEGMSGRMLLREGRATTGPGFAVSERYRPDLGRWRKRFPQLDLRQLDVRSKAIRTRHSKFIWRSDERNELYDLRADATELHDRRGTDIERADTLRAQLFDWFAGVDRIARTGAIAAVPDPAAEPLLQEV